MNLQSAVPSILPVACHTDNVGKGSTFIAIKGSNLDGTNYISLALQKGANKIVVQDDLYIADDILNQIKLNNAELVKVKDCRKALSEFSAQAWGYPADKLNIIGITGTKGKTTSTFLTYHLLTSA